MSRLANNVCMSGCVGALGAYHQGYFDAKGEMINPWGSVEAILTHSLSMNSAGSTDH